MANQNDNTILKKADLKAYHQKILPYLGGNLMMSTNNSDYYSTDEKVIGVWTDGRPIYKRTFSGTLADKPTPSSANFELANTDVLIPNAQVNEIVHFEGFYKGTTESMQPINGIDPYPQTTTNITVRRGTRFVAFPNDYTGSLTPNSFRIVAVGSNTSTDPFGVPFCVTVWYTKTTDAANSALTTPGAYDINFPDTWPENKEIFFGNGVYGQRFTGTHTATTSGNNKDFLQQANKIISQGGTVDFPSWVKAGVPMSWTSSYEAFLYIYTGTIHLGVVSSPSQTVTYDVWVTYTK